MSVANISNQSEHSFLLRAHFSKPSQLISSESFYRKFEIDKVTVQFVTLNREVTKCNFLRLHTYMHIYVRCVSINMQIHK